MNPSQIRERIVRFRILIIGRANAGKTTILQRVCNTKENPEIFDSDGEKIDAAVLTASRERGEHDIENEMVFRNNPGFVFHDSCGFEAGGESEYDKMNTFIEDRSKKTDIKDRIHTIWYCIPMDQASRCFTEAELKFFSRCNTGSIPVIVLFTKFDALYDVEFARLTDNGTSRKDAKKLAPKHAKEAFAKGSQVKFLYKSKGIWRPPKCHVCLPDMDKDDADCGPLIERTAEILDDKVLQQLFVSTQQTNLELCIKYAVENILAELVAPDEISSSEDTIAKLGCWFPHIWVWSPGVGPVPGFIGPLVRNLGVSDRTDDLWPDQCAYMHSKILSEASGLSPLETIVQLSSAAVIIFEHSFYIFHKRRPLHGWQKSVSSFHVALKQYMASPHATAVRDAVSTAVHSYEAPVGTAVHQYEEPVGTAVHINQGNSSNWKAKLLGGFRRKEEQSFKPSQEKAKESFECSQEMAKQPMDYWGLIETILKITLEHRLPRP